MKIDDLDKIDELAKSNQYLLIIQLLIGMSNSKYDVIEWVWDRYKVESIGFELTIGDYWILGSKNEERHLIRHSPGYDTVIISKHEMINTLIELLEL